MRNVGKVELVRVPFTLGCGREGAELGPERVVAAGLVERLTGMGITVSGAEDEGREKDGLSAAAEAAAPAAVAGGAIRHMPAVRSMSGRTAARVVRAVAAGRFPLVLGGDHSVAIGSLAGLTARYKRLGVIWLDAHADINTEATSPSGNAHGIPLAVALGYADYRLTDLPGAALIPKERLVIVGARDIDPAERALIRLRGIACFTMSDIERHGVERVMEAALAIAGSDTDGVHLSLDMDALDPLEAPGVGTPVPGGFTFREARFAMELLSASAKITSMDLVEVNGRLDRDGRTARLAVGLAAALLGQRLL